MSAYIFPDFMNLFVVYEKNASNVTEKPCVPNEGSVHRLRLSMSCDSAYSAARKASANCAEVGIDHLT